MATELQSPDPKKLYGEFVRVLEGHLGPKDPTVIHAIIGFEFGGPPDVLLFKHVPNVNGTFYVTSDLLFFPNQPKNSLGGYELAICLRGEKAWGQNLLYKLSRATLDEVFEVGDTADISAWVENDCKIKGFVFAQLASLTFAGQSFGCLIAVGITESEMGYALEHDSGQLLSVLKQKDVFPVTDPDRGSVI